MFTIWGVFRTIHKVGVTLFKNKTTQKMKNAYSSFLLKTCQTNNLFAASWLLHVCHIVWLHLSC